MNAWTGGLKKKKKKLNLLLILYQSKSRLDKPPVLLSSLLLCRFFLDVFLYVFPQKCQPSVHRGLIRDK